MTWVRIELVEGDMRHCVELEDPDVQTLQGERIGGSVAVLVDRAAEAVKRSAGAL